MRNFINKPLVLAVISGLLLTFSWPATGSLTPLIFLAFVPLLIIEKRFHERNQSGMIKYFFIAFLIWNIGATYFIFCVEEPFLTKFTASALTYLLNSAFMAIVFILFHFTKKRLGPKEGYIALVFYWMCLEFVHYHWDINWPWLNLGNVFANRVTWIQWYEFTGIQGGTLWIWMMNLLIYRIIIKWNDIRDYRLIGLATGTLIIPVLISLFLFFQDDQYIGEELEIVIVQPNIDPYDEKFIENGYIDQLEKMLSLAEEQISANTDYIIFPETALQELGTFTVYNNEVVLNGLWENKIKETYSYHRLNQFLEEHPGTRIIIGASLRAFYGEEKQTYTARYLEKFGFYYDSFNSALFLDANGRLEWYHKSKLVPGTEKMPFAKQLNFLENLAWDLGGTSGSLGKQRNREVFKDNGVSFAPLICYESVFGEYVTDYTKLGGNIICIITNDGWWQDSPGYKQHLYYASLRAIENRRAIARSANTGISALIDQKGRILHHSNWWKPEVIKGYLTTNEELTIYARYGDYLTRPMLFFSALILLWSVFKPIASKYKR